MCGYFIQSKDALQFHLMLQHSDANPTQRMSEEVSIRCFSCAKLFIDPFSYFRHANEVHKEEEVVTQWETCLTCKQNFPSPDALLLHSAVSHVQVTNPETQYKIECKFCNLEWTDVFLFFDHVNAFHNQMIHLSWKLCPICDLYFPSTYSIQFHIVVSHKGMGNKHKTGHMWMGVLKNNRYVLQCIECEFKFVNPFKYHTHANKDHLRELESSWIECEICKALLPSWDVMQYHNLYFHGRRRAMMTEWNDQFSEDNKVKLPECRICNLNFPTKKLLAEHIDKNSKQTRYATRSSTNCQFCDSIVSIDDLEKVLHPWSFISFQFSKKSMYFNHANSCHGDIIEAFWTKCSLCGLYTPSKDDLSVHFFDKHLTEQEKEDRRITCDFCTLNFISNRQMIEHANKRHLKLITGKWKQCKYCRRFMNSNLQLVFHVVIMNLH